MQGGSNRRLANIKTRNETGLDYVYAEYEYNFTLWQEKAERAETVFSGGEGGA